LDKQITDISDLDIKNDVKIKSYNSCDFSLAVDFYISYFKNYDFTVKKTAKDLKTVIDDHILGGGYIFLSYVDDKLEGLCFAIQNTQNNSCIIKELLYTGEQVKSALIKYSADYYNCENICCFKKRQNKNLYLSF
jgi:hypothetical protein